MKYLLLFLLAACNEYPKFEEAKAKPGQNICFEVATPEHLDGHYCLKYLQPQPVPSPSPSVML